MEFKFEAGQRVAIREGHVGYLKGGQTGTVQRSGIVLDGRPEYLVVMDESVYSNVAGWLVREGDLVAEDAS